MQHIFVIMDTVPRYTFLERPLELMLSSNLYVTLRLTVFEIFTVKWENSVSEKPKMVRKTSFLTPHLKTPKDVGIRRDQRHCCRAICSRTKKRRPQMPKCVAFGLYFCAFPFCVPPFPLPSLLTFVFYPTPSISPRPSKEVNKKLSYHRQKALSIINKNLAIANRSRVSCAHNTLKASISLNNFIP